MKYAVCFASLAILATAGHAAAQEKLPPENGKKLSEIIATIEARPDFRYLESVDWERQGYYEITYHTADKARVEIKIDAASGQPRD
jgi:uncharacterized membrane protein YkoI